MATSKKSSTSKTARVMNLLSKNREEPIQEIEAPAPPPVEEAKPAPLAPSAAEAAPTPAASAAPVAAHPTTPPIISSMQADSVIADQVLSALESALDSELGISAKEAPAPVTAPTPVVAPEPDPTPAVEVEPEPVPVIVPEPAPAAAPEPDPTPVVEPEPTPAAVPEPAPEPVTANDELPHPPTRFPIDQTTIYVNVMETLVEEKAMKYIDMFGLCKCPRCVADVKALALNRLDAKYVVMHAGEEIPRISLYEGKFSAAVTAQLLSACKIVLENPRHDRE